MTNKEQTIIVVAQTKALHIMVLGENETFVGTRGKGE